MSPDPLSGATSPAQPRRDGAFSRVCAAAWVLLLLSGMGFLWRYETTPGTAKDAPFTWPEETSLIVESGLPTLVLFVHPCCPCTRATTSELRALLPHFEGRITSLVAAFRPADVPPDWCESEVPGAGLPGARPFVDEEGREAARFGVATSGHVLFYGKSGELRFSGGVLPARGHVGENAGLRDLRTAIEAELAGNAFDASIGHPVFGCSIFADASAP